MAIAPERTGIGIRRFFTTPGTDPYGTVTWERRDARITNWATGAVAFEQLGVEVPSTWSVNATNILAQKYFRGTLGTAEREWSLKQVADRVVGTITAWGTKDGYFADRQEAEAFEAELKWLIVHQRAAFNSPVWFNIGVAGVPQQASACFILAVDDAMDSILNWYVEEGRIFKGGSGAGINLSRIRSSKEGLRGGGTASGPVSFMRGADASAGTIKSGGKTRRAAKMVILDAGHPDIEDFIWCKAVEERKARALRDAGFDMDLDGKDSHSVQYQNANNSVRVTDEFMNAVIDDGDWHLKAVSTGEVLKTMKARELFRQIAKATWECADPGMQFDTTINKWHTAPNTGRINASNPCFTGDAMVHTDKGLVAFRELFARANQGETFAVYTHEATSPGAPAQRLELTRPEAFMITGYNEVVRLHFDNGMEVRCTPGHRFFTTNRGYVEARHLTREDQVKVLDLPAPAVSAGYELAQAGLALAGMPMAGLHGVAPELAGAGSHDARLSLQELPEKSLQELPEKWDAELAHFLGWATAHGSVGRDGVLTLIYGAGRGRSEVLERHRSLARRLAGGCEPVLRVGEDGTTEMEVAAAGSEALAYLGLGPDGAPEHGTDPRSLPVGASVAGAGVWLRVPAAVLQAPPEMVEAFLQGLFGTDVAVGRAGAEGAALVLRSSSRLLLVDVQRLLSTCGLHSTVWRSAGCGRQASTVPHGHYELRVGAPGSAHAGDGCASLVELVEDGYELTYNLSEPRNHSYVVNGLVVRNCSEYMHLDNSACNLASLNLLQFLDGEGNFDVDGFKAAVEVVFTGQEILVGNADYPTKPIGDNSRRFRQLGLGYANLGALLMAQGLPYDSDAGRAWAGAITALMTGHAYAVSARTAARMGPFAGYHDNREPMLKVLRMHREEVAKIDEELVPPGLLSAAQEAWDRAVETAEAHGVRNSQASVLAPTGCLVGGSLVPTDKGLVRLAALGDPEGPKWQDIGVEVGTDEGPRTATKFYVNGLEPVVTIETSHGYRLQGTPQHRVKVLDSTDGSLQWRRLADVRPGDSVPLALGHLIGAPRSVAVPSVIAGKMTPELAELVGCALGAGLATGSGARLAVEPGDLELVEHLRVLAKEVFGPECRVAEVDGYLELAPEAGQVGAATWLRECGLGEGLGAAPAVRPAAVAAGMVGEPVTRVPDAVLATNDPEVYAAFAFGLFRARASGRPEAGASAELQVASADFARELQGLLLAVGCPASVAAAAPAAGAARPGAPGAVGVGDAQLGDAQLGDGVAVTVTVGPDAWDRLCLDGPVASGGAPGRFFDTVSLAALGEEELTYDLSVPSNVTYIANGFVSHNTIGLMMDCDTTGIEPDLGLVKTKKLVGGGTMSIVNQTVPRALSRLGYSDAQVAEIVAYIDEHKSILGAPHLSPDHLAVFACSMGDNTIHYRGHVRMMAAAQPFLSGAISKTVNLPEEATVEEVEQLHIEAWQLGIKAVAIYRDNCKVAQPLATTKKAAAAAPLLALGDQGAELASKVAELEQALRLQTVVVKRPVHEHMPRKRKSSTFSFRVSDCEGYVTVGEFPDGRPGEVFISVSKQGSTLAGIMDAFAISVSMGLQHGVPLATFVRHFTNMRFEPAGMTDDPDLRFASSLVDYIFRRLAVEYMSAAERQDLGVMTVAERLQPTLPGVEEASVVDQPLQYEAGPAVELREGRQPSAPGLVAGPGSPPLPAEPPGLPGRSVASKAPGQGERANEGGGGARGVKPPASDAPYCYQCGVQMQRAGSCFACPSCGTTSGCS